MRRVLPSLVVVPVLLLVMVQAALAAAPSSPFTGHWSGPDPGDGSTLDAVISGAGHVRIAYSDDVASQACEGAESQAFSSMLTGTVSGDELQSTMRSAFCGGKHLAFQGLEITWWFDAGATDSRDDDSIENSFGEVFTRAD